MILLFPAGSALSALLFTQSLGSDAWDCVVLTPEQQVEVDPASGAQVIFVTTHPELEEGHMKLPRCFSL